MVEKKAPVAAGANTNLTEITLMSDAEYIARAAILLSKWGSASQAKRLWSKAKEML